MVDDNGIYSLILKNQYLLLLTALIISSFGFFVFPLADWKQSSKPGFEEYKSETRMLLPLARSANSSDDDLS